MFQPQYMAGVDDPAVEMTPPRYMTPKHPRAVASWGNSVLAMTENLPIHNGRVRSLRPWQRLVINRALECDANGQLVWRTVIVSAPRQVGKSVIERNVCLWRVHQSALFGQTQDLLHVAHTLRASREIWLPASRWVAGRYGKSSVRRGTDGMEIDLPDGSRWMLQAANDNAGVSFALTMVLVDEAWRVPRSVVDSGLRPTLAEANSPQLWMVSTAGTSGSDLMIANRNLALSGGEDVLLIEWSTVPGDDVDIGDPAVWRSASPHWDERREARVREAYNDTDEWQFRQQWLNQWVPQITTPLFGDELVNGITTYAPIPEGEVCFGVDVALDRSHASIVAFGGNTVEVIDHAESTAWIMPRLLDLCARWDPPAIGFDSGGPAANVADELRQTEHAHRVVTLNTREMASACATWFDRATTGTVLVRPHPQMSAALTAARRRPVGQAWIFARDGAASGVPLLAAVLAVWASTHVGVGVEASAIW
jgi:hypothetical protein